MKAFAKFPAVRSIVCALVAFTLFAVQLQFADITQPSSGMTMSETKCPTDKSCCDKDKTDCDKAQKCITKCGSAPGLALLDKAAGQFVSEDGGYFFVPLSLKAHASTPLRRPPRV